MKHEISQQIKCTETAQKRGRSGMKFMTLISPLSLQFY